MSQAFKIQYLARLLALLASWCQFCLVVVGLVNFTVSLAIGGAGLIDREVAVGFSRFSL